MMPITNAEQFANYAAEHNCVLSPVQIQQIAALAQWLTTRAPPLGLSKYQNLSVGLTSALAPVLALFDLLDPASLERVMDLGAGSGALGFTLAIVQPHLTVDLVDRSTKTATFLELTIQHLGLDNVQILQAEAAGLHTTYASRYDIVCFRALAPAATALELAYPFAKDQHYVAAWHQTADSGFENPTGALQRIDTTPTIIAGLAVSLYLRKAAD